MPKLSDQLRAMSREASHAVSQEDPQGRTEYFEGMAYAYAHAANVAAEYERRARGETHPDEGTVL